MTEFLTSYTTKTPFPIIKPPLLNLSVISRWNPPLHPTKEQSHLPTHSNPSTLMRNSFNLKTHYKPELHLHLPLPNITHFKPFHQHLLKATQRKTLRSTNPYSLHSADGTSPRGFGYDLSSAQPNEILESVETRFNQLTTHPLYPCAHRPRVWTFRGGNTHPHPFYTLQEDNPR